MFIVKKTLEIAGAHHLHLSYPSKCSEVHGHNWVLTIYCASETLIEGMVVDFTDIKNIVMELDHKDINSIFEPLNPTAENIAQWIQQRVPHCFRVDVQESGGNIATYIEPGVDGELLVR